MKFTDKFNRSEASNIIIALTLGVLVWFAATTASDPNIVETYPNKVPLEIIGLGEDKLITTSLPETIDVELRAPQSVWEALNTQSDVLSATIDLSNYDIGEYMMPIDVGVVLNPVDVLNTIPRMIAISIENKLSIEMSVTTDIIGEPALGYEITNLNLSTETVQIIGAEKDVTNVNSIKAPINILERNESFEREVTLIAYDAENNRIDNVILEPGIITTQVDLAQSGGYRDVAVTLLTDGVPKDGYHVTNISYNPIIVTLYSANPDDVQALPGYVNTIPLDITGAEANIQTKIALDLPENISVVSSEALEQTINVFVGIAATESSTKITLPIEAIGLNENYSYSISPETVDVIVSGPLADLENLTEKDIHLYIDLTKMEEGTFTAELIPELINESLKIESIVPEVVEVESILLVTPTPTSTQTPTITPKNTPTPPKTPTETSS